MPDLSKAGTTEYDGDKIIRYDEHGNRHIKFHIDYGVLSATMGGLPTVKTGPCLATMPDGTVVAVKEATLAPPVEILKEHEYFLQVRVKVPAGFEVHTFMFPTYAERVRIGEALRQALGATG